MAVDLDGTDDYIDCGSAAAIDNLALMSVSIWLQPDDYGPGNLGAIVTKTNQGTENLGWLIGFSTASGLIEFDMIGTGSGQWVTTAGISTGVWSHICITYNRGAAANDPVIYIGGTAQSLGTDTNPTFPLSSDAAQSLEIGRRTTGTPDRMFNGRVGEFRLFGRILSAQETAILAAGYTGPLGGELVWLPMDGARAIAHFDSSVLAVNTNYLNDLSGNANHGNPTGNPTGYASDCPRVGGVID